MKLNELNSDRNNNIFPGFEPNESQKWPLSSNRTNNPIHKRNNTMCDIN